MGTRGGGASVPLTTMSHAPAQMNATLDVIQGLRERGAVPDGNARAYVRQAIAAGVSRSSESV